MFLRLPTKVFINKRLKLDLNILIFKLSCVCFIGGRMNWDDINNEKNYDPRKVYAQSKLCNILFTRELAKRLGSTSKVTVNALHPGVVMTVSCLVLFNARQLISFALSFDLIYFNSKRQKRNWADTCQRAWAGRLNY